MHLKIIALLFCIPLAWSADSHASPDPLPPDCLAFIASLPADWEHRWIKVPRAWSAGPGGESLQIFYYGNWRLHPETPPVVLFNGGPGGKSWGLYKRWQNAPQSRNQPVVFIDQRGNGCSTLYPAEPPQSREEALKLREFGATAIVRDAEAIRTKILGPQSRWKIFGQSYGSLIVHRYVELFPESLISAAAHGWAAVRNPNEYRKLYREHFLRGARHFFTLEPNLADDLNELFLTQAEEFCADPAGDCPYSIVPEVLVPMFPLPERHAELRAKLEQVLRIGSTQNVLRRVDSAPPVTAKLDGRIAALEVLSRWDYRNLYYHPADPYGCTPAMRWLREKWSDAGAANLLLNTEFFRCEARWPAAEYLRAWIKNPLPPSNPLDLFVASLRASPHLKFFLYSAREDLYSPATYFGEEVWRLRDRIVYRRFSGGHFDFFTNERFWSDLRQ